jgi:hypothetical protein
MIQPATLAITLEILGLVAGIDEFKGAWRALGTLAPDRSLPPEVQSLARRSCALLRSDPSHPSLRFKAVGNGRFYSVRVGLY